MVENLTLGHGNCEVVQVGARFFLSGSGLRRAGERGRGTPPATMDRRHHHPIFRPARLFLFAVVLSCAPTLRTPSVRLGPK